MPNRPDPVIVVGGGLAGMAAAARLAKAGHHVELFERRPALGGRWRVEDVPGVGRVDAAPSVLAFPAPWRDLFRKSGRPLEAELARSGHELVPAPPVRHIFSDGSELAMPTERGEQYAALTAAYGPAAAARWRDLLDSLDDTWQALRPLGLEYELQHRGQLDRTARTRIRARLTLAALAERVGEPHLEALVRSVAYRQGSAPEQTPAWVAVDLAVSRRFGHWQVRPERPAEHAGDVGRSSVLTEALAARLALRRVVVHRETPVTGLLVEASRVRGVRTATSEFPAAAVVATVDPWELTERLLPRGAERGLARNLPRLRPAAAPTITHHRVPDGCGALEAFVEIAASGEPVLSYRRPTADGTVVSRHDHRESSPEPGFGVAWQGFRSWLRRPPVVTRVAGLYAAGPFSAGGNGPSQIVLSGALASYACHDQLTAAARSRSPS